MVLRHLRFFVQFAALSHTVTVHYWHLATRLLALQLVSSVCSEPCVWNIGILYTLFSLRSISTALRILPLLFSKSASQHNLNRHGSGKQHWNHVNVLQQQQLFRNAVEWHGQRDTTWHPLSLHLHLQAAVVTLADNRCKLLACTSTFEKEKLEVLVSIKTDSRNRY